MMTTEWGVGWVGSLGAHLDLIHPINTVQHVLEELLQGQGGLQPLSPGSQQLLQVAPQTEDIVLPGNDALLVMVILLLQLLGQVLQRLYPLLIGSCVRLNGFMLLLGSLHSCQVIPKVILPPRREKKKKTTNKTAARSDSPGLEVVGPSSRAARWEKHISTKELSLLPVLSEWSF